MRTANKTIASTIRQHHVTLELIRGGWSWRCNGCGSGRSEKAGTLLRATADMEASEHVALCVMNAINAIHAIRTEADAKETSKDELQNLLTEMRNLRTEVRVLNNSEDLRVVMLEVEIQRLQGDKAALLTTVSALQKQVRALEDRLSAAEHANQSQVDADLMEMLQRSNAHQEAQLELMRPVVEAGEQFLQVLCLARQALGLPRRFGKQMIGAGITKFEAALDACRKGLARLEADT